MAQPSEQFSGDMSRNEVEIDLNKFMAMVAEIGELKQKIMEMENEREPDNPWQKWIWLSQMIDAWRIFPRLFLSVYIYLLYFCTMWFMDLDTPTLEQSGLISIVVGAGAAWFGLYAGTAKDKINSK
jgi:MFS superfamily sulfate permease-like transporter|tara:strand:+ start:1899 stop:2276 length:378 start_codon:yes stop_codon:yes gene_type:complete